MSPSDKFSFRRMLMLCRLYRPAMLLQSAAYFLISLAAGLWILFTGSEGGVLFFTPMTVYFLSLLVIIGPLVFARSRGEEMVTMLPATGTEKSIFKLLYSFVWIPAVTALPLLCCLMAGYSHLAAIRPEIVSYVGLVKSFISITWITCAAITVSEIALCLWGVTFFRRHKTLFTVLILFGFTIAMRIVNVIQMAVTLKKLRTLALLSEEPRNFDSNVDAFDSVAGFLMDNRHLIGDHSVFGTCEYLALCLLSALLIWSVIHTVRNRQI